uniref:Uncharacterized protein n=1 Tax=Panagrolaimus sp. PS1159 TaxID=55785 RepID=A0AC35FVS4_9BILA
MAPMESKNNIDEETLIIKDDNVPELPAVSKTSESKESEIIPDAIVEDEQPKRKFDARADELFRKQMNEIEQEINRRIQNRNVRKMGHLIREPSPPPSAPKNPTLNQLRSSFSPPDTKLNQLRSSFSPPDTKSPSILSPDPFPLQQRQQQSNPLPAYPFSFGNVQMAQPPSDAPLAPFMPSSTTYSVQHELQPRHTAPIGYIPGLDPPPHLPAPPLDLPPPSLSLNNNGTTLPSALPNPSTITPEMAAMLLKQIQESNPQLLSSLFANQIQNSEKKAANEVPRIPAPPSVSSIPRRNGTNSFHSSNGTPSTSTNINENGINGGENNSQQPTTASTASGSGATGTTGQENNKENSQEPIWVMRDSYLKRLQREEQRNKELQNGIAGSSTSGGIINGVDEEQEETDKLLNKDHNADIEEQIKTNVKKPAPAKKEGMQFFYKIFSSLMKLKFQNFQ